MTILNEIKEPNHEDKCAKCPDTRVVCMGAGKQEEYLCGLVKFGWSGNGFTRGRFMHQTASQGHQYYPNFINRFNLRLLYRMDDKPKLINRYFFGISKFYYLFYCGCI